MTRPGTGDYWWLRFQDLYGVLHGLCVDYEPHVQPREGPESEPLIRRVNHWYWRDDDERWQGNPTPAEKQALRREWAANSLELVANIRVAVDRRTWLGPAPYVAVTAAPLALRTVGGGVVETTGPDGRIDTPDLNLTPDGTTNVYAGFCKLPHETVLMAYRSAVRSTLDNARVCLRLQQETPEIAPVTIGTTNQAAPPSSSDPIAQGLRNGSFFQSGGRQMRFNLDLDAALRGVAPGFGWTGRIAYHQWRGLKHLAYPPNTPVVAIRPAWVFP